VPVPDPAVRERPVRRRFAAEHKLRILQGAEGCFEPDEVGALLCGQALCSGT